MCESGERVLSEIIDAVTDGKPATEEELRLAVAALQSVCMFNVPTLLRASRAEEIPAHRQAVLLNGVETYRQALQVSPAHWLGRERAARALGKDDDELR